MPRAPARRRSPRLVAVLVSLGVLGALVLLGRPAAALEASKDGYFQTGTGTRKKLGSNTYNIQHAIRELPATKSQQALIDADVDKRFTIVFLPVPVLLRPIVGTAWPKDKIMGSFREAFALNAYEDGTKIDKFVGALTADLHDKDSIVVQYNAATKTTSIAVKGGPKVAIEGVGFMKAVWSLWFGKIEQKELGQSLAAKWLEER